MHKLNPQARLVQVNGEQLKLKHPMLKQRKALCRSKSCSVKLRLEPVGALVRITGTAQLRSLVSCLLTTLKHIHEYGFVHRDVRLDNVIRATNSWLLIDWELVGRTNQIVWWQGKLLSDGVKHRLEPYTGKTNLWQIGKLIKIAAVSADVAITTSADAAITTSADAAITTSADVAITTSADVAITTSADVAIISFADHLLAGDFATAAIAQASLW